MFDPPPGYDDMLADAEQCIRDPGPFRELDVEDVGIVMARRPLPNAVPAFAMAASPNTKISDEARQEYLTLFVTNHLQPGEYERVLVNMMEGDAPAHAVHQIAYSLATWGTGRPTRPSARLAS
ncbi:hypothetical protein [Mycolicibacterium sp.]|uniref:hypothetical protein n=1 Tax=Mycolicibacterium sp. TaxID=2320850 RepID=UPI00355F1388